jgi:prepilin-type N-terminal cleavage/methylation domain-containing protein
MYIENKKGFTLIETIVVITITSMVLLGFTMFFIKVWEMNHFAIELGYATLHASRGVDDAVKNIRRASSGGDGAHAVEFADVSEFIFYANYDGDDEIERIRYFLNDVDDTFNVGVTNLDTTVTPPIYDVANDEIITRVANYVVNNSEQDPIFTYYDLTNTELTSPVNTGSVSLVKILLFVNVDQIRQPNNVRIQSQVLMRNLSLFGKTPT